MSSHHIVTPKIYGTVLLALAFFMTMTCVVAKFEFFDMGRSMNLIVALAIATTKTVLVMTYFMHVKFGSKLVKTFVITAPIFLGIMFILTFMDFMTRGDGWWSPFVDATF